MKEAFEKALFEEISQLEDSRLKEAAYYALQGEAKRIRPLVAYAIANILSPGFDNFHPLIALELAHTSSLILDDLPMMDDATERRNKPALHIRFNQQEALLTAVGLISESYKQLHLATEKLSDSRSSKECLAILQTALNITTTVGGLSGAPFGQWMDLTISSNLQHPLLKMMHKKTGVFFESSFVLGWIFGGGSLEKIEEVKEASRIFGTIFQILDDFSDLEEDAKERPFANYVLQNGQNASLDYLDEAKERFAALLCSLGLIKLQQALLEPLENLLSLHRSLLRG